MIAVKRCQKRKVSEQTAPIFGEKTPKQRVFVSVNDGKEMVQLTCCRDGVYTLRVSEIHNVNR